ncbi:MULTISPECIES: hypothetical protein [Mycolicibacter]|uniref:Uncharacterized protein n=2 Tax=Mycolicibacter TaxID=1073531 RepID=A0ABU5XNX9_9MYCO|nr:MULTISPECIES: hypothetical protein [unclassified Mycolicibacter]MEB3023472.1 hypothetical protein [Mycolicibacter sp. MYC098]MEB3035107.1 hypothetical protein [Mycolicibacter sp. MYC340]
MTEARFKVRDLVQLDSEYKDLGNPSLFQIRSISAGKAILGQLGEVPNQYVGVDTEVELDSPDLVAPYPEVLALYPWVEAAREC